jgi:hypothetical protein
MNKIRPNIFNWATSELSQDAFICWLLSWVNHNDNKEEGLNKTANYFLSKLTDDRITDFQKVEIYRQFKSIDILVKVNDHFAILIEDKTHTKNHSGQLERYYQVLSDEFDADKIIPVYLKTGDQGNYNAVKKAGYKPFLRTDFLDVLEYALKVGVSNNILLDFHHHLTTLEQSFQSYITLPASQWHWDSWKGFYTELGKRLGDGTWDYVPQKNGGFLGFWWCWQYKKHNEKEFEYYLQLEHNKFCFKLYPYKREQAEEVRSYYRSLLYQKAREHKLNIHQNGRIGNYMTVAALTEPYLKTNELGMIDFEETVGLIKKIEKMICEI